MSKFYVVNKGYSPNTAPINRQMGMLKAFGEKGIETEAVFFIRERNEIYAPEMEHIHYKYYWKLLPFIKNEQIQNFLFLFVYVYLFAAQVKKGDTVYIYGCNRLVTLLAKKKGITVFHERTENPEVSNYRFDSIPKYLESCKYLDGLFVISTSLKDYFIQKGVSADKIHIINMTVDSSRFEGIEKTQSERYIAYCGKATNNKDGVDQLIKAFALTHQQHPDVKLYIIGTPPHRSDESGNLELVERLGIMDSVIFTGLVSAAAMPQLLLNAEVLALARPDNIQAKYGFPTKLGEYLLTGNPVVITRVGDIPLFLKDGESALIAEPQDAESFASKLNWALANQEEAKAIGIKGKQVALAKFDSRSEAVKMLDVIFG